jgi:signal transduction histidine kinase
VSTSVRAAGRSVARRRGPRVTAAASAVIGLSAIVAAAGIARTPDPLALAPAAIPIGIFVIVALMRPFEPAPGEKFSLGAAVAFFAALVLPGSQAILTVGAAASLTKIAQRRSVLSAAVNVGVMTAATAAASMVVAALPGARMVAVIAGGIAYAAVALAGVGAMVVASSGRPAGVAFARREVLPTTALLSIGAIAAVLWQRDVLAILLLAIPLALLEVGLRRAAAERAAIAALNEALAAQRRFTEDAAHELRTPLTALIGNLAFVRREALDPAEADAIADAERTAASLRVLTERLLTLSRAEAGVEGGQADLAEVAREVVARVERRAGVALSFAGPERADTRISPELARAIVGDLVTNAVAYTEQGAIEVRVEPRGGSTALVVRDTGIGIGPDELGRVFDRFYRGALARSLARGSGLGLSIVRGIAEAHRGSVTITSTPGRGTVVEVLLPAAGTEHGVATAEQRA